MFCSTELPVLAHTQAVERSAGHALAEMVAVADQAFRGITTVRWGCYAILVLA
jgi:hypothetical protein